MSHRTLEGWRPALAGRDEFDSNFGPSLLLCNWLSDIDHCQHDSPPSVRRCSPPRRSRLVPGPEHAVLQAHACCLAEVRARLLRGGSGAGAGRLGAVRGEGQLGKCHEYMHQTYAEGGKRGILACAVGKPWPKDYTNCTAPEDYDNFHELIVIDVPCP